MASGSKCCGCYRKGRCESCICVRSKRQCKNCRPDTEGHCQNPFRASATATTVKARRTPASSLTTCDVDDHRSSSKNNNNNNETGRTTPTNVSLLLNNDPGGLNLSQRNGETPPSLFQARGSDLPPCLDLPPPTPISEPKFVWGNRDAVTISKVISDVYTEVIHWKKMCFSVPFGQHGKQFISELARLYRAYGERSSLESVALKAAAIASVLLLMKPHVKSTNKEHTTCLQRRLELWQKGEFEDLLIEGRTIQRRLKKPSTPTANPDNITRHFSSLMAQGKTSNAVRQLLDSEKTGVLDLNSTVDPSDPNSKTVLDVLKEKHPPPTPCYPDVVIPFLP